MAGAVIGMAAGALLLAYVVVGWPILVVGGPLLVGVALTVGILVLTERPRALLAERRAATQGGTSPWQAAGPGHEQPGSGLMSGFFEMPASLPEQRPAPSDARPAGTR
ncbi:hypothetical protein [Pseudonocardia sp. ICBG1293]|uniref:hypothetical protein n=1 Tax=Pseudonocardia sp. ICBG1293 TaxID=2844382 RepID=UPI001CCBB1F6|nr:hypothetical protein [Pseudonocardia sp. ICBG1293]